ncbi:MAG: diguanylate cyclase [Lachnospiraceae bacterium]|nr:diguanylate cyclase [Lachnospiraceae bacterium]
MSKDILVGLYMVVTAILTIYSIRLFLKKDDLGKSLIKIAGAGVVASLSYTIYLYVGDHMVTTICHSLLFLSVVWALYFTVKFSILYTKTTGFIEKNHTWLSVIAVVDSIMIIINPYTKMMMEYNMVQTKSGMLAEPMMHPLFLFHVAFCHMMAILAVVILVQKTKSVARFYQARYYMMVLFLVAEILLNGAVFFTHSIIDYSILAYGIIGPALYFYAYDFRGKGAISSTKAYFVEEMDNPVVVFDNEDRILLLNRKAREILGIQEKDSLETFLEKSPYIDLDGEDEQNFETSMIYRDMVFYFRIQYKIMKDHLERIIGHSFIYLDVSEQKRASLEANYNASHDMLTGTYNRNYCQKMKMELAGEEYAPFFGAIYSVGCLSEINEHYGIEAGDKVLRRMAWLLQRFSRVSDYVIRMNGGEMLVLLPATSSAKADEIFGKINRRMASLEVEEHKVCVVYTYFSLENINQFDKIYEEARREVIEKRNISAI